MQLRRVPHHRRHDRQHRTLHRGKRGIVDGAGAEGGLRGGAKAAVMGVSLFRGCDTPGGDGRLSPPGTLPRGISERSSRVLDTERMFGEHVCGEQPFVHSTRTPVRLSTIDHKKSPPCPQAARQGREFGPTEVPMSDTLTTRQREILDCIVEHQNDRGYPRRCVRSVRRSA